MNYKKLLMIGLAAVATIAGAQDSTEDRLAALEKELAALKGEQNDLAAVSETKEERKFRFGGYGEIHANWVEGDGDKLDIHRLVLFLGYDFNDWIKLNSEIELEHAWTDDGYLLIEQLYADFLLSDPVSIRAGRVLAPLGIINQNHEPPLFNGVERPNVEKYIIPSTWSLDGVGLFGYPLSWLSYEVYAVAGLNESGFSDSSGVRSGREKGRVGMNSGALTGRLDFFPLSTDNQDLRIGLSGYYGGTDNTDNGDANSNTNGVTTDNTFGMVSGDFEYDISRLQFRGVAAFGSNSDAENLDAAYGKGAAEEIFGWYLEAGVDVLPTSWKKGKLKESSFVPFIRYEEYDTAHKQSDGSASDGSNHMTEVTAGVSWLLTQNFVVKADVQFVESEDGSTDDTKYNAGIGWVFN